MSIKSAPRLPSLSAKGLSTASVKVVTGVPFWVYRRFGSAVKRPMSITLFIPQHLHLYFRPISTASNVENAPPFSFDKFRVLLYAQHTPTILRVTPIYTSKSPYKGFVNIAFVMNRFFATVFKHLISLILVAHNHGSLFRYIIFRKHHHNVSCVKLLSIYVHKFCF